MANFSVTITEILGTDSMNNSRITINNNFATLAASINTLANFIDPANGGTVGSTNATFTGSQLTVTNATVTGVLKVGNTEIDGATLQALIDNLPTTE